MKAVMLSDHSKELYSTDMPPAGLQLVNDDLFHYKRHRIDGPAGGVMLWANVPPISYDQSLAQQLRLEVPMLTLQTRLAQPRSDADPQGSGEDRPLTACVEMEEWLNSPISEVVCR
ncbi:hypothetical protein BGZ70_001398 [Mortierella alpina]|uniref:Uncharacterized protein n=1 Tax=Mortierella alpina TaxID=64518 RepID=A0A9P6IWM6_MORAP|nr:hypothetical protein BGZ70_001398 [Mortierella alpina]